MKTLSLFFVTVLATAGIFVGAPKLFFAGQGSGVAASEHSALLRAFAEMNPIDAHVHLYKDDPAFGALLERLKLRILDICLIDDRDPFFKAIEPQRGEYKGSFTALWDAPFCARLSALMTSKRRDSAKGQSANSTKTSPMGQ